MNNKKRIILLFSIFMSGLLTVTLWNKIRLAEKNTISHKKTERIIVAGSDISPGDIFTGDNLRALEILEKSYFPIYILEEELDMVTGARSKNIVKKGEPILWKDLRDPIESSRFSRIIHRGKRAISITANENISFTGLLRPGDRVDVYLSSRKEDGGHMKTILLLEEALVGAVDSNYMDTDQDISESYSQSTVTLIVTRLQAACLLKAQADQSSRIDFVLRNPSERRKTGAKKVISEKLKLEIFKMGRLEETKYFTRTLSEKRGNGPTVKK